MVRFSKQDAAKLRAVLQEAGIKCSERCLYQSAKWVTELASTLDQQIGDHDNNEYDDNDDNESLGDMPDGFSSDPTQRRLERREFQRYLLAKSYFDCREFDRCAAVFLKSGLPHTSVNKTQLSSLSSFRKGKTRRSTDSSHPPAGSSLQQELLSLSQKAIFLALYAKYMSGEKRKDEENEMILGPADRGSAANKQLGAITQALETYFSSREQDQFSDGWLEYLYGIVLARGKSETAAKQWLVRSVLIYPYNWGAWQELNSLIGSPEDLSEIFRELQPNMIALIFNVAVSVELYQVGEGIHNQLRKLEDVFPGSAFLQTQKALLYYHSKDFEEAESIFAQIISNDPHRLDALDHYSNILYVMDARPKLAFIAALANATDKFRPETCCVVGNYYSLKSEHEKAVQYFRRALQLDRSFLSAWTLMGHEFVEMKNTHAAIEAYRRAVDVNRKDYRAWYGLGQTYEVLEMHFYALFYFQRAAALRPFEAKMWHAVGSCCDRIGRPLQGIKAYKRALVSGGFSEATAAADSSFNSAGSTASAPDGFMVAETLFSIASMYEKLGDRERAAKYMEMTLAQEDGYAAIEESEIQDDDDLRGTGTGVTKTTSRARIWLARWEAQRGGFARAMELAHELCHDGIEVEEAKALIRDIKARLDTPMS